MDMLLSEPPARTYGKLCFQPSGKSPRWEISDLEPHVAIRFKQIFPRVPKGSAGPFHLPHENITAADLRWFTERYPLAIAPADRDVLDNGQRGYLALQAEMERIFLPDYAPPTYVGLRPGEHVRHYQAQAIELCARSGGLLLGDECGLGKTYTAAAFCLAAERLPAVIVCPLAIQSQWVEVIRRYTTLRVCEVKKASPYDLPPADVYVFRYTQLGGWVDIFQQGFCKTVVYDEPQDLRTGMKTNKGQAAAVLSRQASWRLGLTATPIYNYGQEIFQVMQFINADVLGDWPDFCREYLDNSGKINDPKALGTYLRDRHAFLRRTKHDVGKELAAVNRIVDLVDYDEQAIESIEDVARQLSIKATTGAFVERGHAARDLDLLVRQATGIAKAEQVAAVVRIIIESGEPVILFGWHRAVYEIWQRELHDHNPVMYTGSETGTQKRDALDAFKSGKSSVILMSLRSAAGIDGLQHRCSTVVFGELDWSPGIHHQCIERVNREGQINPVMALFLVAEDGSDPPIMEMLGLKSSQAAQIIDPTLGVQSTHSDRSRLKALVDRYLSKEERSRAIFLAEDAIFDDVPTALASAIGATT